MKILFVVSEVEPLVKTGGLADVAAALPKALQALGHDVRIVIPRYRAVSLEAIGGKPTRARLAINSGKRVLEGEVWQGKLPQSLVPVYCIEQPALFDRGGLYQEQGRDFLDNLERFSFFAQAALYMLPQLGWRPDVIHCHDWQAALSAAHLKFGALSQEAFFKKTAAVFTIHNLAYQGIFPKSQWPATQLPNAAFSINGLEFYDQVNCLKGGIIASTRLTTVSPTYAREIQTPEFGCGLDGLLRMRAAALTGILNGIDADAWNPATDPHLPARYDAQRLAGKRRCKQALQESLKLPERDYLLIGMVQRLVDQKGIDVVLQAAEQLMALPLQIVLLGSGEAAYHRALEQLAARYRDRISVTLKFDEALAHQIEAGADAFIMASRFEPCGLNQMYSLRYGTIPIVRRIGGLADTVVDLDDAQNPPTGFVFDRHSPAALISAVSRALAAYQDRALWAQLMRTGMRQDFSWSHSAAAYQRVYEEARADLGRPRSIKKAPARRALRRRTAL